MWCIIYNLTFIKHLFWMITCLHHNYFMLEMGKFSSISKQHHTPADLKRRQNEKHTLHTCTHECTLYHSFLHSFWPASDENGCILHATYQIIVKIVTCFSISICKDDLGSWRIMHNIVVKLFEQNEFIFELWISPGDILLVVSPGK